MNILGQSQKPRFFRVDPATAARIQAPAVRLRDSIRTCARSLSAMQKEALIASSRTGAIWRLVSDEGAYLAGDDEAPCPLSFLTTGMVCSYMNEILSLARTRDIDMSRLRLVQDNYYTMRGSALRGTMVGGARDVELEAQIDSDAKADTLMALVTDATMASPLNGLMQQSTESLFSLTHNRRSIPTGRVAATATSGVASNSDDEFEAAQPAAGDFSQLIVRHGMSPKSPETTGFAGSSLAEQQDRVLHVRGIATLGADGIKKVNQMLFNPHGSIFHFLCDEAPENGGHGRAPDANTYISAGIAFCFMTQLGRYAKIAKKDLLDYRVVQDTHFSFGGATGGTGKPGQADPVETHLYIESQQDDEFARTALDMSEQTCFLHALCRSALTTHIRIRPFDETPAEL